MTDDEFAEKLSNLVTKAVESEGTLKVVGMLETLKVGLINKLLYEEINVK